jgi:arginyl-tRNA synthetase
MTRNKIAKLIEKSIKELQKSGQFAVFPISAVELEKPEIKEHGDYSTSISLKVGKTLKKDPTKIAELIAEGIKQHKAEFINKIKVVKPGFINFFISDKHFQSELKAILKKKEKFTTLNTLKYYFRKLIFSFFKIGSGKKVQVEFISANPTGPLTLGNGRGGFCGDVLANIFKEAGYDVEREYYVNDVGEQIRKLGHSVIGDEKAVYRGKYIEDLREKVKGNDAERVGKKAAKIILEEKIKPFVEKEMGIKFDVWFSEDSLYKNKEVDNALKYLKKKKLTYEKEGALWFNSTKFGDDKDRVLVRKNGETTYFASDIAYLKNKFKRGFRKIIYFLGADHYGYVNRMKAVAEALGHKKEQVDFVIMQLVAVMWGGEKQRMSKRKGIYWGLDKLIKEFGIDIVRFFFLTRSADKHLVFDLDLIKEESKKNPVYYIQYAFARISSILEKSGYSKKAIPKADLSHLKEKSELDLIEHMTLLPEIIEDISKDYQVQKLPKYASELAALFHRFYEEQEVLIDDKKLREARLNLVLGVKIVLEKTLDLMGISAPEKM